MSNVCTPDHHKGGEQLVSSPRDFRESVEYCPSTHHMQSIIATSRYARIRPRGRRP